MRKILNELAITHPETIDDLRYVKAYYAFEWQGKRLRCIPLNDDAQTPCNNCHWRKQRSTLSVCPMIKACMAHLRPDGKSVKFISDELSSLNLDETGKMEAMRADEICYRRRP